MAGAVRSHELRDGWHVRNAKDAENNGIPCSVPTCVHLDLLAVGKIQDPYKDYNELDAQWIGDQDWIYSTTFDTGPLDLDEKAVLVFEGLDTVATVSLNGHVILESNNMFLSHRVDVTSVVSNRQPNDLVISFKSAQKEGRRIQETAPQHKWLCSNGDPSRLAVRKAQYHWGWDWGPKLLTCGPWKPIRLEKYRNRISDFAVHCGYNQYLETALIVAEVTVEGNQHGRVVLELSYGGQVVATENCLNDGTGQVTATFYTSKPKLWYPRGYGNQPLYKITAEAQFRDAPSHKLEKHIGLRRVELIQDNDEYGESFYFRVNGVDIFCGGSNWIPADCLLPRVEHEEYKRWLQMLLDGDQNMVRVWGGGVYEPTEFYNFCDTNGILVWQDFMFACGNYPAHDNFLKSVENEAKAQLKRLHHHPSIILYAGNNEDYQIMEQNGLTYDPEDTKPENWLKTDFPARYIYEHILPNAVRKYAPSSLYRAGSPFSEPRKNLSSNDSTVGDIHQWNVWHGTQEPYQNYPQLVGRFVSEFGMQALPSLSTIKTFSINGAITDKTSPQSRLLAHHNKATGATRRLYTYLSENLSLTNSSDLATFVYQTQLIQSNALSTAYKTWRKDWGTRSRRKCGGALVWQLNDVWPCTSWAIVDHTRRPKPAYFAIKRALAPLTVGVMRDNAWDWEDGHATTPPRAIRCNIWVAHTGAPETLTSQQNGKFVVQVRFIDIATGTNQRRDQFMTVQATDLVENGTTDVMWFDVFPRDEEPYVVVALLFSEHNDGVRELIAMDTSWPQPIKWLPLADDLHDETTVKVTAQPGSQTQIDRHGNTVRINSYTIQTTRPIMHFVFDDFDGASFSDNGFDVIPGFEKVVDVTVSSPTALDVSRCRWTYMDCRYGLRSGSVDSS